MEQNKAIEKALKALDEAEQRSMFLRMTGHEDSLDEVYRRKFQILRDLYNEGKAAGKHEVHEAIIEGTCDGD